MSDSRKRIIIVDDDSIFLDLFIREAKSSGRSAEFDIIPALSGHEALALAASHSPDAIISDVQMPGLDGLDLFAKLRIRHPSTPVIFFTAFGSMDKAVQAVKLGAYHYFQKPVQDLDLFWKTVSDAVRRKKSAEELENTRIERKRFGLECEMIGDSPVWLEVVEALEKAAPLPTAVFITGETGVGKEIAARAIHRLGPRKDRPFIAASCVEFADSLLESELFGHEKGAFTGAANLRRGIFERAHGGTLFLDEIAEAPPSIQAKLLRVIEGASFCRVGGQEPLFSDFRLIAAANRNMNEEVQAGRFRQDLFYRLNVFPLHLPPLRERTSDILPLTLHFLNKAARKFNKPPKTISGPALALLSQFEWPGNVRQLENLIERAVIMAKGKEILVEDMAPEIWPDMKGAPGLRLSDVERLTIMLALKRSPDNKTQAAEMLGISRKTLNEKINKFNLE